MTNPTCPKCKGTSCIRVKRDGFLQESILPKLGRFPWECTGCRNVFLAKLRGTKKKKRSSTAPSEAPETRTEPPSIPADVRPR